MLVLASDCGGAVGAQTALSWAEAVDADHDGISDELEEALLQRFVPQMKVSRSECDVAPSEFLAGSLEPQPVAQNGTLYGQVFPVHPVGLSDGAYFEAHYYHLWRRDCGAAGHWLDAEHVSVLLRAPHPFDSADRWQAVYWYAAAHEDTVCDVSTAARAEDLHAVDHGAQVWISRGKHASHLTEAHCRGGCGGDRCEDMTDLSILRVINLGELHAPLAGAVWVQSPRWPLAVKLASDFDPALLSGLQRGRSGQLVMARGYLQSPQSVLLAGAMTFGAVDVSGKATGTSLSLTSDKTGNALAVSTDHTGKAVGNALGSTGHALDVSAKGVGGSLKKTTRGVKKFFQRNKTDRDAGDADASTPKDASGATTKKR